MIMEMECNENAHEMYMKWDRNGTRDKLKYQRNRNEIKQDQTEIKWKWNEMKQTEIK